MIVWRNYYEKELNLQAFRRKFMQHQKSWASNSQDFIFELINYFQEWLEGLHIDDFSKPKEITIVDQMKQQVYKMYKSISSINGPK